MENVKRRKGNLAESAARKNHRPDPSERNRNEIRREKPKYGNANINEEPGCRDVGKARETEKKEKQKHYHEKRGRKMPPGTINVLVARLHTSGKIRNPNMQKI